MEITLKSELEEWVVEKVASGEFASVNELVEEALWSLYKDSTPPGLWFTVLRTFIAP